MRIYLSRGNEKTVRASVTKALLAAGLADWDLDWVYSSRTGHSLMVPNAAFLETVRGVDPDAGTSPDPAR